VIFKRKPNVRNVNNIIQSDTAILVEPICILQAVNTIVFSVEKLAFLAEHFLKTESFKTKQNDYSQRYECPPPAKLVVLKSVKQFNQTANVNIPKRVRLLTEVTGPYSRGQ
jgi:hypothetical protein